MTEFEKAVVEEVKRVREMLKAASDQETSTLGNHFSLSIEASGRIIDGEVNIKFGLGAYSTSVSANSVGAAVTEYLRRNGWEARHSGLCLAAPTNTDDIPF